MNNKKLIGLVVPCFKAQTTLKNLLSSVRIQSFMDKMHVYLVNDDADNTSYQNIIDQNNDIEITEIKRTTNGGPGAARDDGVKACKEDYVMFMDADDVFYSPYAVELLYYGLINSEPNTRNIMCQGVFVQEASVTQNDGVHKMLVPMNNPVHPWSFGRILNTQFVKENNIEFTDLRAMEDGTFFHQVRLLTEGTNLKIKNLNDFVYVWHEGSEHSITRVGSDRENHLPYYNFSLCQLGAALGIKYAIDKVRSKNPFNNNYAKFASETIVGNYFTYYECLEKDPVFAPLIDLLSKWIYAEIYLKYASNISENVLEQMSMQYFAAKGNKFKQFPKETFKQWLERIKTSQFSLEDFDEVMNNLPEDIKKAIESTGVFKEPLSEVFGKANRYAEN